jgi:hypothetical protein
MTRTMLFGISLAVLASLGQTPQPDPLLRARAFYNQQEWDKAIEAAALARQQPDGSPAAVVVLARAHLERYRVLAQQSDLDAARQALKEVEPDLLTPADHVELLVGLGLSLYLDDRGERHAAAAELFAAALDRVTVVAEGDQRRERILEWWCGALDRQAQTDPASARFLIYARIMDRIEQELARDDRSTVALYWKVAAARGMGDLARAWGAAEAAWIRARYLGPHGADLRADLDQLVVEVILPERAQMLAPDGDPRAMLAELAQRWAAFKSRWEMPARRP